MPHRQLTIDELTRYEQWITDLTQREEEVVRLVHGINDSRGPMTVSDAGRVLGITQQAASKNYKTAAERVRGERPPARRSRVRETSSPLHERVYDKLLDRFEQAALRERAKELPVEERMVLRMFLSETEELTETEIAGRMQMDEASVMRTLKRACRRLDAADLDSGHSIGLGPGLAD